MALEKYKKLKQIIYNVYDGRLIDKWPTHVYVEGVIEDGKVLIEKEVIETKERFTTDNMLKSMNDWDGVNG